VVMVMELAALVLKTTRYGSSSTLYFLNHTDICVRPPTAAPKAEVVVILSTNTKRRVLFHQFGLCGRRRWQRLAWQQQGMPI